MSRESAPARKLTPTENRIMRCYTSRDKTGNVWLKVGHQSFMLHNYTCPEFDTPQAAQWRRRQLAIALARLVVEEGP